VSAENLAEFLQVAFDARAKNLLRPMASVVPHVGDRLQLE
jgi:predicted ATP-dependent Lon-type protease